MSRQALREQLTSAHEQRFGARPTVLSFAPGRVEILGNHTDYNEGLALSSAIEQGVYFALSPRQGEHCTLYAADLSEEVSFDMEEPSLDETAPWVRCCRGVHYQIQKRGARPKGVNATFLGDLPPGQGMGSSAALEVAFALALAAFHEMEIDRKETALLCREAESQFGGVRCGLLDQVTSLWAQPGHVLFTDFRTLELDSIPAPPDSEFVVCHLGKAHQLRNTGYNERRQECEHAAAEVAKILGRAVRNLRDVSREDLQACKGKLDGLLEQRAMHVISENQRVQHGLRVLKRGDSFLFGAMMYASHESSMTLFENSTFEQDFLVLQAKRHEGVVGARLTGGGFGGGVVLLVRKDELKSVTLALSRAVREEQNLPLAIHVARPSGAARLLAQ